VSLQEVVQELGRVRLAFSLRKASVTTEAPMMELENDMNSTLVRRGTDAATFQEMVAYATLLEGRPLTKLLEELPALAHLSQAKFDLTAQVLRRRFKKESEVDRLQLETFAEELALTLDDPATAGRIRHVFRT
jgi:hypothetical protein